MNEIHFPSVIDRKLYFSRLGPSPPPPSNIELKQERLKAIAQGGEFFKIITAKMLTNDCLQGIATSNHFHMNHRARIGRNVPFILRNIKQLSKTTVVIILLIVS